jgi:hypothetical protein
MLPLLFVLLVSVVANHRSLPLFLILVSSAVVLYRDLVHPRWSLLFFAQALAADFDELVAGVRELRPVAITTAVLLLASAVIAPSAVGGLLGTAAFWLLAYHLTLLNVLAEPVGDGGAGGRSGWVDHLREKISQPVPTWTLGLGSACTSLFGLVQLAGLAGWDPAIAEVRLSQFPLSLLIPAAGVGGVAVLARWWASSSGRDDPRSRQGRVGLFLSGVTLWMAVAMVALIVFRRAGLVFPFGSPELNALGVVVTFGGGCLVVRVRRLGAAPASATGVSLGGIATIGAPVLPFVGWLMWRAVVAGSEDRESPMSFALVALVIVIWAVAARFWARLLGTDAEDAAVSWVCCVVGTTVLLLAGVVASAFGKGTDLLVVGALMTWGWGRLVGDDLHKRG